MNKKNEIRKMLFSHLTDDQIDLFYKVYNKIFHRGDLMKKIKCGNDNSDIVFFVIRPRKDCVEGLLSLFWNVMINIEYANKKGYVPIVDFKNYETQYWMGNDSNAWEFYFTQPTKYKLENVYRSKNVILSGLETLQYNKEKYRANYDRKSLFEMYSTIFSSISFSDEVLKRVEKEMGNLDFSNVIGLYLRGTDYTNLKPSGHPVQPSVKQAEEVVDMYIEKYHPKFLFLVTEDGKIYEEIKQRYGDLCRTVSFDKYVYNYDGKQFLSHDKSIMELCESPYERGMNYLTKIVMLSRCGYIIGGNTNGMWAACAFSGGKCKDYYIFDLGTYGK